MRVILIGYMGAGKTTFGKALAQQMDMTFCDLDWYIEEQNRTTISQIFKNEGETAFREKEREALHKVMQQDNLILAVGGGTPCFYDNIDFMNQHAHTIYLSATPETLKAHIRMGGSKRPLVDGKTDEELTEFITTSLKKRESYYQKAADTITIPTITRQEEIDECVEVLKKIIINRVSQQKQ